MLHFCIIYFNPECLFLLFRGIPVCFDENQIEMSQKTTVVRSYCALSGKQFVDGYRMNMFILQIQHIFGKSVPGNQIIIHNPVMVK